MPNEIVPETQWGTRSFGLADARTVQVQIKYATQQLHLTRSGACRRRARRTTPAATATYGVEGLAFPYFGDRRAPRATRTRDSRSATAALPRTSSRRTRRSSRSTSRRSRPTPTSPRCGPRYPGVYGADGFFDAVNPDDRGGRPPGSRARPVDDHGGAGQRARRPRAAARLRARPVSWAAHTYLSMETMFDSRLTGERGHAPGTVRDQSGAPGGLRAAPGRGHVTLDWEPVPGAAGYLVHRAARARGPYRAARPRRRRRARGPGRAVRRHHGRRQRGVLRGGGGRRRRSRAGPLSAPVAAAPAARRGPAW